MNISDYHPIIVIDEDPDDLRLLSDAHKDLEIKNPLVSFRRCEEVMPYLLTEVISPQLIICDYRFRTMNGPGLRRQLLANNNVHLRQIPFVIWSSVPDPIDQDELDHLGIQALILKPTTYVGLLATYNAIINRWGKKYQTTHCADTTRFRLHVPASILRLDLFSRREYLI